ncbi:unnamed protein product, partial [Staurois parvus]
MYVKCFETKMTVSKMFKFAAGSGPRTSHTSQRSQGPEPDAGIGRRRWPVTLQGTH